MHKLTLALDELVVETFAPAARPPETGTVHANASGPYTDECYNCLNTDYDCDAGSLSACPCTHTCYNRLTCGANTCDQGLHVRRRDLLPGHLQLPGVHHGRHPLLTGRTHRVWLEVSTGDARLSRDREGGAFSSAVAAGG